MELRENTLLIFNVIKSIFSSHGFTDLQMTDVNHDARISALEENGGSQNGKQIGPLEMRKEQEDPQNLELNKFYTLGSFQKYNITKNLL